MATYAQRAQAIVGTGVRNDTATNAQIDRVGRAIAANTGQADFYAGLTDAQKAQFIVAFFRATVIGWVREADTTAALAAAQSSAATDLPEAP